MASDAPQGSYTPAERRIILNLISIKFGIWLLPFIYFLLKGIGWLVLEFTKTVSPTLPY